MCHTIRNNMKTFKDLDSAISQLERDYKEQFTDYLGACIANLEKNSICKYNETIYIIDEYDLLK